jgi:hypothetical protein
MTIPVSYRPICHICNKPVQLETAKTDDAGSTVHEGCYLLNLKKGPRQARPDPE